ncbi:MAG: ankyrin [Candidatus Midichloriaceae bacterium]|jgi:ankyrin repeat protein|nr:ankyrin [Candidatus Midichloriaceae bacterium]
MRSNKDKQNLEITLALFKSLEELKVAFAMSENQLNYIVKEVIMRSFEHEGNQIDAEIIELYKRLELLEASFIVCAAQISASKLFERLICYGAEDELNFKDLSDKAFMDMAILALKSSTLNTLPDEDTYSYFSIGSDNAIVEHLDRQQLEEALRHMLSARNYELSEEVVCWAINISLNGLYNHVKEHLGLLEADIKKLPEGHPDKQALLEKFNEFKEEIKAKILIDKDQDIENCQRRCIEAFLKNLHDKPDDNLGFEPKQRLRMVIEALRGCDITLDLREMNLKGIGVYLKELDISNVDILLTPEQEEEFLTKEQRLNTSQKIFKLVEQGDIAGVEALCQTQGMNVVNTENAQGRTPLMLACISLQVDMVKELLALGANPNLKTETGYQVVEGLLMLKNCPKKAKIVELLIEHGIDISDLNIAAGIVDLSKTNTIYAPESINQMKKGSAPVHVAIENELITNVEWLISKGANVNLQNDYGATPLHLACEKGNKDIVILLLEKGADSTIKWAKETPLCIAIKKGYNEIADELLAKGAILDLEEINKLPKIKQSDLITHAFINEVAKLANVPVSEILKSTIIQQNLMGLVRIKTNQICCKIKFTGIILECFINFENYSDLDKFKNYYTQVITSCSVPPTNVDQVHFEFDGKLLYDSILPQLKTKAQEETGTCLMM